MLWLEARWGEGVAIGDRILVMPARALRGNGKAKSNSLKLGFHAPLDLRIRRPGMIPPALADVAAQAEAVLARAPAPPEASDRARWHHVAALLEKMRDAPELRDLQGYADLIIGRARYVAQASEERNRIAG